VLLMRALYAPFTRNKDRLQLMDLRSAEFTKYAANAMLATRISFMNELALLAERVGADIELVRRGIGSDPRIGTYFLYPGAGYGGSCFPKDVKALIRAGRDEGLELGVLAAVEAANERQKMLLVNKVVKRFGEDLGGRTFALWGLAFKPDTDDVREAPSLVVVRELTRRGARLQAYDPAAMPQARRVFDGIKGIAFAPDQNAALAGADALLILTEWREFRSPDFELIRGALKQPLIFDGRNMFDPPTVRALGIEYSAIGRGRQSVRWHGQPTARPDQQRWRARSARCSSPRCIRAARDLSTASSWKRDCASCC
jgi:UDPglucose 6-dehydrogenase